MKDALNNPEEFLSTRSSTGMEDQPGSVRKMRVSARGRAIGAVLAAVVLWSSSYVVTKIGVSDVPPITFGAIRFAFAALLVLILAPVTRRLERVAGRDLLRLGAGGLLGITAYFSLQNLGVARTTASEATLLVASFPAITLLLEGVILRKRAGLIRYAGVALAFLGIYLIIRQTGDAGSSQRLAGDLFLLATGLAWALYNFVTQETVRRYSTFTVIFWQTLAGTVAFLPLTLLESASWRPIPFPSLLSAIFLGIFCSVCAFFLYGIGLKTLDPGSAVSLMNLVPVFGLILAVAGLKETLYPVQILGGAIVIAGVVLSVRQASGNGRQSSSTQ